MRFSRLFSFLLLFFYMAAFVPLATADDDSKQPGRSSQGYEISKGNFLDIPPDMKIRQIPGTNVINAEPDTMYMARKIDAQEKQQEAFRTQLAAMETRLKKLESKP